MVLQSHLLYGLDTVVVAPLMAPTIIPPDGIVALDLEVGGERLTLNMPLVANIALKRLGPSTTSLALNEYEIRRALDRLFTGF